MNITFTTVEEYIGRLISIHSTALDVQKQLILLKKDLGKLEEEKEWNFYILNMWVEEIIDSLDLVMQDLDLMEGEPENENCI